ncbi:hypothetical protein SLITO_v1c06520 [Spiroplasma litorale]|uniref:Uncharacterized protein n=1 Tax=Spiroplasma litorale TaxID=216942 RepID=A0A0K1W286_9MOLU|nr:hypothetical protein SLITO_v1c06520 [Spiroplasma litorale]
MLTIWINYYYTKKDIYSKKLSQIIYTYHLINSLIFIMSTIASIIASIIAAIEIDPL